jgi:hypothetical protein
MRSHLWLVFERVNCSEPTKARPLELAAQDEKEPGAELEMDPAPRHHVLDREVDGDRGTEVAPAALR